jgi:diguanylate cyclase (GGDEF)-like protein
VHLALHDVLTDLPNRAFFFERLQFALTRQKRFDEGCAVLYLDLDRFKPVNDTYGHRTGDQLLCEVANRLEGCLRATDTAARFGGDEFAVLLTGTRSRRECENVASRILRDVSEPYVIEGKNIVIGVSIGISMSPFENGDADEALGEADIALYRAKEAGRGKICFYEREMDARERERRSLEADLSLALARDEFELAYQPIFDLRTGEVTRFESLLRWNHPTRGRVSPAEFIALAEKSDVIIAIGAWVIREACKAALEWPTNVSVAVNLSVVQFRSGGLLPALVSALADTGLSPRRFVAEITESLLLNDTQCNLNTLRQMHALGVRVALDDFGTGYSSLGYLRKFPFDALKIDRSFLTDIAARRESYTLVRAIVDLAHNLNMTATAEGIENEQQLAIVRELGCNEGQGYHLGMPGTADAAEARFAAASVASREFSSPQGIVRPAEDQLKQAG